MGTRRLPRCAPPAPPALTRHSGDVTRRVVCVGARGSRHAHTLISINNYAELLKTIGDTQAAKPLYKEALDACRETLGK